MVVSGDYSGCGAWASRSGGLFRSRGSTACWLQSLLHLGSVVAALGLLEHRLNSVALGLRCSKACGIISDQGSHP